MVRQTVDPPRPQMWGGTPAVEDWKSQPHWVLRFNESGKWDLVGPDGKSKHVSGLGVRHLTVDLDYMRCAEFNMDGIFVQSGSVP